ncbi:hypothetical protein [Alkalinema sp. FACHB-956]|uniref:hypothetical protein n=1 Tax=Alkalinema sp. FACHB-956 TaxID=2692768 RepID=UPI001685485E|nr:hypothetical protein [Alkalinema sp. FACHB-956]MBD2330026.1 hypothetical protein [Alkalinema sp. FACHB-956]
MNMSSASPVVPTSTVGFLPLHDFQVLPTTPLSVVVTQFKARPQLPGVLVMHQGELLAVLSRSAFFEQIMLERPFAKTMPIQQLLSLDQAPPLIVSDICSIPEAAEQALKRPSPMALDPLVLQFRDGSLRLVDLRDLVIAQAQFQAQAQLQAQQIQTTQQQQLLNCQNTIAQLRQELTEANQTIEVRNLVLQNHQQHLERQQTQLCQKNHEVKQLHKRLETLQTLLDSRIRQVVQQTLNNVSEIGNSTDRLIHTSVGLAKDVETVHTTSSLIQQVSKQARFLGLHTAILVNRFSGEGLEGFSQVISDITRLVNQTAEADRHMGQTLHRIKGNIAELAQIAQAGANSTQTLIQQVGDIDEVLAQLENLIQAELALPEAPLLTADQKSTIHTTRQLMRRIEQVSTVLADLYTQPQHSDLRIMIQNIEQNLKRNTLLATAIAKPSGESPSPNVKTWG